MLIIITKNRTEMCIKTEQDHVLRNRLGQSLCSETLDIFFGVQYDQKSFGCALLLHD